ncbi:MAG: site-specific integrase [Desulfobacteraceae bacterium]|nr:site-specific integrase [Desulfobacteraceae bacterium]
MGVKIRQKPAGSGNWWIFINHNGQRKSKRIGTDKKVAREVAKKIEAKLTLHDLYLERLKAKVPKFKEYAEHVFALPAERKQSTLHTYRNRLNKHIYPAFGNMRINDIRRKDLKMFFDKLAIQGLKPKTITTVKEPISIVLKHAVDTEIIEHSPCQGLTIAGAKNNKSVDPLTEQEAEQLLEQVKGYFDGKYYAVILLLLRTGARIGEALALTWADIDFEGRTIEISKTKWKNTITTPKNGKSRRVDMTLMLLNVLRELKQKHWHEAAKGESLPDAIFPFSPDSVGRALTKCLKDAGLKRVRLHGLRHSYASIRLMRGHTISDVSYQLGHSDISLTFKVYTHWIPGNFKAEVDELDTHLSAPYAQPIKRALEI